MAMKPEFLEILVAGRQLLLISAWSTATVWRSPVATPLMPGKR